MKRPFTIMQMAIVCLLLINPGFSYTHLIKANEERDLPEFRSINLSLSCEVYVRQGNQQKVVLKGDPEELEEVETRVSGRRLTIQSKTQSWFGGGSFRSVKIYITVRELESVSVSGSGNLIGEEIIESDFLELKVSGSGSIKLSAKTSEMEATITGSGNIQLEGQTEYNDVVISGSGKLRAENLEADRYSIRISGSGSCRIHVNSSLDVRISGSGNVRYSGNPDKVNSKSTGSGSIKKVN